MKDARADDCLVVGFEGFLNVKFLIEVLKRMRRNPTKSLIKEVVEGLGIDSRVSFGPNEHQGLDRIYYTALQGNRFVPLPDWKRWEE